MGVMGCRTWCGVLGSRCCVDLSVPRLVEALRTDIIDKTIKRRNDVQNLLILSYQPR